MSKKSLKYFMREQKEEIVTVPGPETFKDEDGNVIDLEIKVLSSKRMQEINDRCVNKIMAKDKKGRPLIGANNEVAFCVERDNAKASRHMMVEALVYPNLKDPDLMNHYNCTDVTDMPMLVFSRPDEFAYLSQAILRVLGLTGEADSDDKEVSDAKN